MSESDYWEDAELLEEAQGYRNDRINQHKIASKEVKMKRWNNNTYVDTFDDVLYHMSWAKDPPDVWDPNRGKVYFADEETFFSEMFPEEDWREKEYHLTQPLRLLILSSGYWRENGELDIDRSFEDKEFPNVDGFMCKRLQDQRDADGMNDWSAATYEICVYPKALHKISRAGGDIKF